MKKQMLMMTAMAMLPFTAIGQNTETKQFKKEIKKANNFYQANNNNYYDVSGIGHGIDAIKGHYGSSEEIKTAADIFDPAFLDSKIKQGVLNSAIAGGQCNFESTNSMSGLQTKFASNLNFSANTTLSCKLFSASYDKFLNLGANIEYKNYISTYFYHVYNDYRSYNFTLPNTVDLTTYKTNLTDSYKKALNSFFLDPLQSYEELFGNYGTHVVSKGTYGGTCDIYYTIASNSIDLDIGGKAGAKVEAGVSSNFGSFYKLKNNTSLGFDLNLTFGTSENNTKESFYSKSYGGAPFTCISMNDLPKCFSDWAKTINAAPAMIQMNNLIPIWRLLPKELDNSQNINTLKQYFIRYALENSVDTSAYDTDIPCFPVSEYKCRANNDIYKITNANKFNNDCDVVDLKKTGYSPKFLSNKGYKKAKIEVFLNVWEINNGTQEIYLYSNERKNNIYELRKKAFNYGGDYLGENPGNITFTFYFLLDEIKEEEKIVIRYGAKDGKQWYNAKAKVKITYSIC